MNLSERLHTFVALGDFLRSPEAHAELQEIAQLAYLRNNWFTPENSLQAIRAIATDMLSAEKLYNWTNDYNLEPESSKAVGVVMAGNIPAVGFHDLLAILISGHKILAKPSTQDFVLIQYFIKKLTEITPAFADFITVAERLNAADAFIATGSDNTARYFEYYFAKKPHIIRRNRSSVGILTGQETEEDLDNLGDDILNYFGLGCRNVSTILVPDGYSFEPLLRTLEPRLPEFSDHHKYRNNYDYNKSIYLVNGKPHYDNGFLLVTENDTLVSPISVLYSQTYRSLEEAQTFLAERADKIQVIASKDGWYPGSVALGQTQHPSLTDYPDGIDTLAFLSKL